MSNAGVKNGRSLLVSLYAMGLVACSGAIDLEPDQGGDAELRRCKGSSCPDLAQPPAVDGGSEDGSTVSPDLASPSDGGVAPDPASYCVPSSANARTFYASPAGSATGDGSAAKPWDLVTALSATASVAPGDRIWVRGGTYQRSNLYSTVAGTSAAPILVCAYPGERATLDGNLIVQGGYVWLWGLEVMSSVFDAQDVMGVNLGAPGVKAINLVVHDHGGNGLGVWEEAPNAEVYGNVVYYNGRQQEDGAFAHGIYIQNLAGANNDQKWVTDNVLWDGFGFGVHAYGEGGHLENLRFEGNILANHGGMDFHLGGTALPAKGILIDRNYVYRDRDNHAVRIGYEAVNLDAQVTNNIVVGEGDSSGTMIHAWTTLTLTDNLFSGLTASWEMLLLKMPDGVSAKASGYSWNRNSYLYNLAGSGPFVLQQKLGGTFTSDGDSFAEWRTATGFDTDSTFTSTKPAAPTVIIRPNKYEAGRANLAVYNWAKAGSVSVNLSSCGLKPGQSYKIVDAQNFYGPAIVSGTYDGSSINLPMTSTAIATPQNIAPKYPNDPGLAAPKAPYHTSSAFGVFVVLPGA